MKIKYSANPGRVVRTAIAAAIAAVLALAMVASAEAGVDSYCNGCHLSVGEPAQSDPHGLSTLNYGHRLASAGNMIVYTWSNYYSQNMCSSGWTTATQATCDPKRYSVVGITTNGTGSGHDYNAHLNYG